MSDSQRPNPPHARPPSFEVPDLELEPVPRSVRRAPPKSARPQAATPEPTSARSMPQQQLLGRMLDFGDDLEDLVVERTAQPDLQVIGERARGNSPAPEPRANWPTGRAPDAAELQVDRRQLAILADYGEPPDSAARTLAYAYRVFVRQRELKRQLLPIARECERAELEREATLAEFSQAVRPALEQIDEFRRFLAPLLEIEQRAAARGQALTSINAQLGAEHAGLDAGLSQLKSQVETEQRLEDEARRVHDEREESAQRADAKLKRVQIEIRSVTSVAEQKLGPQGGQIPEPEAAQLQTLGERAEALRPQVAHARAEFEQAKQVLAQARARLAALRQNVRLIGRKKQVLGAAYQHELGARSQGVSDAEIEQRAALAELARAILAAPGTLTIPAAWLDRVRNVSERAAALVVRAEMFRRAIAAYDVPRARQGVRLACTAIGLVLVLFAFKLIF